MNQRERLKDLIVNFCNENGNRTFTLKQLNERFNNYEAVDIGGKTPQATVRRLLQELRNDNFISFLDYSGCYTLRGVDLLESEQEETKTIDISNEKPMLKEYLIETYVRKTKWAELARQRLGCYCLFPNCSNTFIKNDGTRYVEVHHIIPLCQGGEDGLWNLSVLCAHHHRMSHFADAKTVLEIQNFLIEKVKLNIAKRRLEATI